MYLDFTPAHEISIGERIVEKLLPRIRERRLDLEREANTDPLTGLASRAAFDKARRQAEADKNICFIIFDCNNFGLVNKRISHTVGNETLMDIALEIGRAARAFRARAFRYGGDEFVVLCDRRRAVHLRDAIEARVGVLDFDSFQVSISGCIGASFNEADAELQARKAERKAA